MKNLDLASSPSLTVRPVLLREVDPVFGLSDVQLTQRMQDLSDLEIQKSKVLGLPVARYNADFNSVYLEYAGGERCEISRT